ncbi:hypothetical protein [Frateuria sp. Soil773]|uniref:hypothetical protein n=1 Tax=Frateuria sp. Soil773 TaxID=1736407 RepID=UPI0012F85EF1|nr:hypothetical protein [Frateuria sp. Soil773]
MRKAISFALISAMTFSTAAFAQTNTGPVSIQTISTGWLNDSFGVVPTTTTVNPAGCANPGIYNTKSSLPGYTTVYAAVLTAYNTDSKITLIISNTECANGYPEIMGVDISK